ncbi:hypothetical protein BaRGS_00015445 [Batillaria attramentaria]|uniref:NADH dehydrogenase [ubiquinone] 1 beta subcomplex subunit 10 n=1 Tax=Batillaria attramentaria TaxID=370345 RepID=A0ABD0L1E7_9CAEN
MSGEEPPFDKFAMGLFKILDGPVTYVREKIVEPIQNKGERPKYYHRQYPRVKTVDQCETDDAPCVYEANEQFRRDKQVDSNILKILRQRKVECYHWEGPDAQYKCKKISDDYEEAATNWFIKYGDIGVNGNVIDAYMKQKHRLIWQRRNPDKPIM